MITSDYELQQDAKSLHLHIVGVYSKDKLPHSVQQGCYFINLSDERDVSGSINGGTHWCAIHVENDQSCWFDPFGLPPVSNVQLFLYDYQPILYSEKQIQSPKSGWCGLYCLFFLWYMDRYQELSLEDRIFRFDRLWSDSPEKNLDKLKHYLKHFFHYKIRKQTYETNNS